MHLIFCKTLTVIICYPWQVVLKDSVFTKVFNSNDWRANCDVIFLMELTAKWPGLYTRIWYAEINQPRFAHCR